MLSGIAEFATLTVAAVIAIRRTRGEGTREARIHSALVKVLAVGYPLLGLVYLTDRLGTLVEPVFFLTFSAMILTEVVEPTGRDRGAPTWAEGVTARAGDGGAAEGGYGTPRSRSGGRSSG